MSKQQSKTAFSSTHTKYAAAAKASKEIIWLRHLLVELHEDVLDPTELYINIEQWSSLHKTQSTMQQ